MRFNRRFTAIAAIGLTAALVLAGCTKKNEESSGTTAPAGGGATSAASGSAGGGGDTGKTYKVAFVPKLQGIPYFEAMNAGGKEAEAALGNVQWLYQGPTQADAAAQADIVRTFIQQKVDTLFIAPNDPDSMAPLIKQAMVLMATAEGIGKANTDALMKAMGGKGKFAIVSCGETATNLNQWIDEIKKYSAEKYPDASIVDVVYAGEDVAKATQMGTDLMNAHPDMTGMVGVCSTAGPGIAQAVANANKIGKVYTVGMGTPNDMKKYLESGAASAGVLWDAKALGYLTAWAGVQMAEGKPFQATQKVADGALENVTWDESTKTLLMGDPLTFTKETVGNYNF
jgi:rhamnose transport system substrate-binding protein